MVNPLVLTVLLPLLGAGGVLLLSFLFSRLGVRTGYVRVFIAALAVANVFVPLFALEGGDARTIVLSSPYAASLADSAAEIRWDTTLWPLGLSLSIVVSALLLGAVGSDERSYRLVAALLTMVAATLAALWSANPLTTIVCWAFYDLAFALARIAAGDSRGEAVRSLAIGTVAGFLLWAGVLVAGGEVGGVAWTRMPASGAKMTWWVLAGFLRLGVYPLHISSPRYIGSRSPLVGALFLSPLLGWGLWIRLALANDRVLPVDAWMAVPALLTLIAGGFLAWTTNASRESRPWISVGWNGAVILATVLASLGGEGVVSRMTLGAAGWMMVTAVLFLGGDLDLSQIFRWEVLPRGVASLIGAFSLIGIPATVGFVAQSSLISDLLSGRRWGWIVAYVIGQMLVVAAVLRWLPASEPVEGEGGDLVGRIAHGVAFVGLAVSLVGASIVPRAFLAGGDAPSAVSLGALPAAPDLVGWLLWGGALLLGGVLAWLDARLRPGISLWLDALHDIVRFDWAYELLMGAFEQGFAILRAADQVLSGRGVLLWSCLVLLIVVLITGG